MTRCWLTRNTAVVSHVTGSHDNIVNQKLVRTGCDCLKSLKLQTVRQWKAVAGKAAVPAGLSVPLTSMVHIPY